RASCSLPRSLCPFAWTPPRTPSGSPWSPSIRAHAEQVLDTTTEAVLFRERRDARFLLEIRSRTATNGVDMRKSMAVLTRILLTSTVVAVITGCSQSGKAASDTAVAVAARPSVPMEVLNGTNFHLLDFVAWNNNNMDMFRRLH